MAGGIFTDRPFEPNPKCIIFAIIMILAYLYIAPDPNVYVLPIIFVASYVAMAWYDWMYDCDVKMYSGKSGIASTMDSIFKPQRRAPEPQHPRVQSDPRQQYLLKDQEKEFLRKVYMFHAFIVAPLLLYMGYKGNQNNPKMYGALMGLGAIALIYHGTRLFVPR